MTLTATPVCRALPGWSQVGWNITTGSQGYGTFSALLAGFAISGLLWIAASDRAKDHPRAVLGLWAAIIPLAVATLLYAEVGAEEKCQNAAMEIPLPSFLLTVGAVSLFVALYELIIDDGLDRSATRLAEAILWVVAFLGTFGVFSANISLLRAFDDQGQVRVAIWLTQLLLFTVAFAVAAAMRRRSLPAYLNSYAVLGLTVTAYAAMYGVAFKGFPSWAPSWLAWSRTFCWMGFLLVAMRMEGRQGSVTPALSPEHHPA